MEKLFGFIPFLLLVFMDGFPQSESEPEALKLLENIKKNYNRFNQFKLDYSFLFENISDSIKEQQSGSLFLKGDYYKLIFSGQEIICDNKNIWTYLPEINEVTISYLDKDNQKLSPKNIFFIYEKENLLCRFYNKEEKIGDKSCFVLDMTPKEGDKSYFRIRIWIDKKNISIIKTTIFEKLGNRFTYQVNSFTTDIALDDMFFVFQPEKYPGIEVIDLR